MDYHVFPIFGFIIIDLDTTQHLAFKMVKIVKVIEAKSCMALSLPHPRFSEA